MTSQQSTQALVEALAACSILGLSTVYDHERAHKENDSLDDSLPISHILPDEPHPHIRVIACNQVPYAKMRWVDDPLENIMLLPQEVADMIAEMAAIDEVNMLRRLPLGQFSWKPHLLAHKSAFGDLFTHFFMLELRKIMTLTLPDSILATLKRSTSPFEDSLDYHSTSAASSSSVFGSWSLGADDSLAWALENSIFLGPYTGTEYAKNFSPTEHALDWCRLRKVPHRFLLALVRRMPSLGDWLSPVSHRVKRSCRCHVYGTLRVRVSIPPRKGLPGVQFDDVFYGWSYALADEIEHRRLHQRGMRLLSGPTETNKWRCLQELRIMFDRCFAPYHTPVFVFDEVLFSE